MKMTIQRIIMILILGLTQFLTEEKELTLKGVILSSLLCAAGLDIEILNIKMSKMIYFGLKCKTYQKTIFLKSSLYLYIFPYIFLEPSVIHYKTNGRCCHQCDAKFKNLGYIRLMNTSLRVKPPMR